MKKEKFLSIITKEVVTATEETTARDITCLMKEYDIGVVVILRSGEVVGVVSERDIARRIVAEGVSPETTRTKDFMTKEVISVQITEGLNKIYQTLCEIKFRHLIIMDKDKLVGITSRRDLLDALSSSKKL